MAIKYSSYTDSPHDYSTMQRHAQWTIT